MTPNAVRNASHNAFTSVQHFNSYLPTYLTRQIEVDWFFFNQRQSELLNYFKSLSGKRITFHFCDRFSILSLFIISPFQVCLSLFIKLKYPIIIISNSKKSISCQRHHSTKEQKWAKAYETSSKGPTYLLPIHLLPTYFRTQVLTCLLTTYFLTYLLTFLHSYLPTYYLSIYPLTIYLISYIGTNSFRTYLLSFIGTCLFTTYPLTFQPTYFPSYPPNAHFLTYLLTFIPNYLLIFLPTYFPTYLPTYPPTYPITSYLLSYLPSYLPIYLLSFLLTFLPTQTYFLTYLQRRFSFPSKATKLCTRRVHPKRLSVQQISMKGDE